MKIRPVLNEFHIPGIERIGAVQKRRYADVPIPGFNGSLTQDLGSESALIVIEGSLAGDEPREDFLTKVREFIDEGKPLDFTADILTATEVNKVCVRQLDVFETAGSPDPFSYRIVLQQYVEPPKKEDAFGFGEAPGVLADLDMDLDLEADGLFDLMELPDLLGSIPDVSNPLPPVNAMVGNIESIAGALSVVAGSFKELFPKKES